MSQQPWPSVIFLLALFVLAGVGSGVGALVRRARRRRDSAREELVRAEFARRRREDAAEQTRQQKQEQETKVVRALGPGNKEVLTSVETATTTALRRWALKLRPLPTENADPTDREQVVVGTLDEIASTLRSELMHDRNGRQMTMVAFVESDLYHHRILSLGSSYQQLTTYLLSRSSTSVFLLRARRTEQLKLPELAREDWVDDLLGELKHIAQSAAQKPLNPRDQGISHIDVSGAEELRRRLVADPFFQGASESQRGSWVFTCGRKSDHQMYRDLGEALRRAGVDAQSYYDAN